MVILCLVCIGIVSVLHGNNLLGQISSSGTSSSSASGSVRQVIEDIEQQRIDALWQERLSRAETFFVELRSEQSTLASLRRFFEQSRIRQLEHRRTCATDLRTASKFTKLPVTLRCYKADLQLETERLRRQHENIEQMLGVNEDTRSLALTRLTLLSDAIKAIITGIDSNVYAVLEDLEESKRNLLTNYREPAWLLLTKLRAEQLSTWTDALITRAAQAGETLPEADAAVQEQLLAGIQCLEEGRNLLDSIGISSTFLDANQALLSAVDHLSDCPTVLRNALGTPVEVEEVPAENNVETIQPMTRLQRRLLQQ